MCDVLSLLLLLLLLSTVQLVFLGLISIKNIDYVPPSPFLTHLQFVFNFDQVSNRMYKITCSITFWRAVSR